MQELMSRHKAYSLNPRDCLKTTLFQKWQRMVAPPGKRGTFLIINFRHFSEGFFFSLILSIEYVINIEVLVENIESKSNILFFCLEHHTDMINTIKKNQKFNYISRNWGIISIISYCQYCLVDESISSIFFIIFLYTFPRLFKHWLWKLFFHCFCLPMFINSGLLQKCAFFWIPF